MSLASLRIFVGMLLGPEDLLTCGSFIDLQTLSGVDCSVVVSGVECSFTN